MKIGERYEDGRVRILAESLARAGVSQEIANRIMEGGEDITRATKPEIKAAWMGEAMHRMDKLMDRETRYAVRQGCACCLGGKRLETSKAIYKNNASLEDRIRAANEARLVFGHSVTQEEDGSILVRFAPEGLEKYACVCLRKAQEPISVTYCYCCGGHINHHLQTALGRKLVLTVRSSALSSGGRRPCAFSFTFAEPVAEQPAD